MVNIDGYYFPYSIYYFDIKILQKCFHKGIKAYLIFIVTIILLNEIIKNSLFLQIC